MKLKELMPNEYVTTQPVAANQKRDGQGSNLQPPQRLFRVFNTLS
jgi:hypothetical protein